MKFSDLTEEHIQWLKQREGSTRKQLFNEFSIAFDTIVNFHTFKSWCHKLGIKASGTGKFDGSQKPWAKGLSKDEFWSRYSDESRERMINAPKEANRTARIGDIRIKAGIPYICVSVDPEVPKEKHRMPLARYVWETNNGPIPKDHMIIHLNHDHYDCRLKNLACIPKSYRPTLLKYMKSDNPEVNKTTIKYCELLIAIKEANVEMMQ